MFPNKLSAQLLNAFVTLARTRQFHVAAQRCHMSQPAFSQAVRRLETEVGVRLFDRSTRNVSLTPEGELLLPVAERILGDIKNVVENLRDHAEHRVGKVAVAALPSICAEWLPPRLVAYRTRYPNITLHLHDVVFEQAIKMVREGSVDFAVNAGVGLSDEFDTRLLFEDRFYLICRPDHALAGSRNIRLKQLAGQTYIHSTRAASVWRQLHPRLHEVPLIDSGFEVGYMSTVAGLIVNNVGVSVVPGISLFHFTRLGLASIPVRDEGLRYEVTTIKRHGRSMSVAARALEDLLALRSESFAAAG